MDNGIRDIHYMDIRLDSQKTQFKRDTSKSNYDNWSLYESWLIGQGRQTPTLLKQLGTFKRLLKLYPATNIKELSREELIELNSTIVQSKYKIETKIGMQLFLRAHLNLFADDVRKKDIKSTISILSNPKEDNPDSDEIGKVISNSDFSKIYHNMLNDEFKIMVKILYSTGMRVSELYNITPGNVQFINKKIFGINLPVWIFGYKCGWIYTRGKRTKSKREGKYLYYISMYVNEFNHYLNDFKNDEYICKYSYSRFLQNLHESVQKSKLTYRVYPHMFRHTVATRLFKVHSDAVVKKIMNWSKNSNMPQHYSHINRQDIVDAMDSVKIRGV